MDAAGTWAYPPGPQAQPSLPLSSGPLCSSLGTWRPVHLPLCCLASVWFGVCLTSTLLQNGYFLSAETTIFSLSFSPCPASALPKALCPPQVSGLGWIRRCFVFWFLPGASKRGLRLPSDQTWSPLASEWKDHGVLNKNT